MLKTFSHMADLIGLAKTPMQNCEQAFWTRESSWSVLQ
jgi:hypothetical protein